MPVTLSSQTYIIRTSYKDIVPANSPIMIGGKNIVPDLSVKVEVNSQQSHRVINFLKCLSILMSLPENALQKSVSQLETIRDTLDKEYVFLQPVDLQQIADKYSSFPHIASLVGNLEKDYESLYSNSPKTIKTAEKLMEKVNSIALKNNWWWHAPLLNISVDNEIVLEWWNLGKKITIYVKEEVIDYIKLWGADIENEMEDGSISLNDDLIDLWQWIGS